MVSVIIPFNKDRGYLAEAIASVHAQTEPCELVTVEGNCSLGTNFNAGVQSAKGEFIMVLAEDDYLLPNAVKDLHEAIEAQGVDFICANARLFGERDMLVKSQLPRNYRVLAEENSIHGGTVMYRRQVLIEVGGMDTKLSNAEEYELHLRLLKRGYRLGYVDKLVHMNRYHADNKSRPIDRGVMAHRIAQLDYIKSQYKV